MVYQNFDTPSFLCKETFLQKKPARQVEREIEAEDNFGWIGDAKKKPARL